MTSIGHIMGPPDQEPTAAEQLAWLDKDASMQVSSSAHRWLQRQKGGRYSLPPGRICYSACSSRLKVLGHSRCHWQLGPASAAGTLTTAPRRIKADQ